eukprot:CAMPEP_0202858464 /NCGR_PEP_ID=MMETSP1391-20130828/988_1 /ASSEMBLY_ACC=CAM_ASM_000867 /TAXON_ID=1034604 /ORGANISM="Chlamydomonas leiostraca, Strain SAG 11-49" /LENGTH=353 /DNA_ID=CAMNT_0049537387 /DNA_START=225 /DNA_END=1286 /DNA_ORIENTATION=+
MVVKCKAMGLMTSSTTISTTQNQVQRAAVSAGTQVLSSWDLQDTEPRVSYELVQGALARWTTRAPGGPTPPTCVLVHGILGNRRNMQSFARMLVEGFPSWQVLLVDLRCHGESASLSKQPPGPHTVATAAVDILTVLRDLKLFPHVLVGHSFGGKVVMSMVSQFGQRLPRNVQVWVLDSLPGEVRSGLADGRDRPADLIQHLRAMPLPLASRADVTAQLERAGFSTAVARWAATSTRPLPGSPSSTHNLGWSFDLAGIQQLYASYEATCMWPLLEAPPQGLKLDFVKAQHSTFRWGGGDEARISALGHRVHVLPDAGHWVHTDNPLGLFDILAPSFGGAVDLRQQRPMSPLRA